MRTTCSAVAAACALFARLEPSHDPCASNAHYLCRRFCSLCTLCTPRVFYQPGFLIRHKLPRRCYGLRIVLATEENYVDTTSQTYTSQTHTYQMPIPLVVTKRYEGQRVTSWRQPATQTNRDPNRDKTLCGSTSNGTDQYQNGSSNLLTPYREQPRSTRNVVAYPRPAFSAKKRKNYAPTTSFDQQVQVSQGHTLYRNKKKWNTEVHGGGGLELVKPAREPASSRPKPCASLKKLHESCPFAAPCGPLEGRKMTLVRHQLFPQKPPGSSLGFSRTEVQPSSGSSTIELSSAFAESGAYPPDRALPGSPRQCSLPLACRHPPEGHQIGARKRRAPGITIFSGPYRHRVNR